MVGSGGADAVIAHEGTWARIYRGLDNYSPTETSASFRLKKIYNRYLRGYEAAHFDGTPEQVEAANAQAEIAISFARVASRCKARGVLHHSAVAPSLKQPHRFMDHADGSPSVRAGTPCGEVPACTAGEEPRSDGRSSAEQGVGDLAAAAAASGVEASGAATLEQPSARRGSGDSTASATRRSRGRRRRPPQRLRESVAGSELDASLRRDLDAEPQGQGRAPQPPRPAPAPGLLDHILGEGVESDDEEEENAGETEPSGAGASTGSKQHVLARGRAVSDLGSYAHRGTKVTASPVAASATPPLPGAAGGGCSVPAARTARRRPRGSSAAEGRRVAVTPAPGARSSQPPRRRAATGLHAARAAPAEDDSPPRKTARAVQAEMQLGLRARALSAPSAGARMGPWDALLSVVGADADAGAVGSIGGAPPAGRPTPTSVGHATPLSGPMHAMAMGGPGQAHAGAMHGLRGAVARGQVTVSGAGWWHSGVRAWPPPPGGYPLYHPHQ